MGDTKQINATLETELVEWIDKQANKEKRSFSQMVAVLLFEAKETREKEKK